MARETVGTDAERSVKYGPNEVALIAASWFGQGQAYRSKKARRANARPRVPKSPKPVTRDILAGTACHLRRIVTAASVTAPC